MDAYFLALALALANVPEPAVPVASKWWQPSVATGYPEMPRGWPDGRYRGHWGEVIEYEIDGKLYDVFRVGGRTVTRPHVPLRPRDAGHGGHRP